MAMALHTVLRIPVAPSLTRRSIRLEARSMHSTADHPKRSRRSSLLLGLSLSVAAAAGTAQLTKSLPAMAEEVQTEYSAAASGLEYRDTLVGSGEPISKGTLIKAHYTGRLLDGTVFDSSYKRNRPLTFKLGVGEVIKGWDEGILGGDGVPPMLPGGKRKLKIPSRLGYGERGAGCSRGGSCVIPPNAVLLFDVELIGKA